MIEIFRKSVSVHLLCIFTIQVFLAGFGLFASVIEKQELFYLEQGLEGFNVSLHELKFDRKWATDDTFRLKVVTKLMDNPLEIPDFADAEGFFCDSIDRFNLSKFIVHASELIDARINEKGIAGKLVTKKRVFTSPEFPESVSKALSIILNSYKEAQPYLERSISRFSDIDKEVLLVNSPVIWSDEDDSLETDSLKGVLHKEFGLPFDTTSLNSDTLLGYIKKVDRKALLTSSFIVQMGIDRALKELRSFKEGEMYAGILLDTNTVWGRVVVGGSGIDNYDGDYAVIIDIGGNDRYSGRFASGIGIIHNPFSIVIDLEGDDVYSSEKVCNIGSGILGCGILVDLEGDDVYRGSHNSIASGLFGTGVVIDCGGRDFYEAGYFSEGAALVGIGILYDEEGDDIFRGFDWTQGMGSTFGYGIIIDKDGNDVYIAGGRYIHHPLLPNDYRSFAQGFGMGFRPDAGGGIGFLYDTKGNDFYNAEVFAQGTSYWYSLGMLLDREGNDYYNACEYAQGAGIHLSIGVLVDCEGSDHYFSRLGPSQGEGHDLSVGILVDKKGNDSYIVSGGQGVGLTNSVGIFLDCEGNDIYASSEKLGQGSANRVRGFGGLGAFVDIGGRDTYAKSRGGVDETIWTDGEFGVGIDVESGKEPEKKEFAQRDTLDADASVERIFEVASLWEVAENKSRVGDAREKLKRRKMDAIKYVIENKMDTKSGLELRAIEELAKAYPDSINPLLIELLADSSREKRGNAVWVLGKIKAKNSVNSLMEKIKERNNWRLRNTIVSALGEIGEDRASKAIIPFLYDKKERLRITSARSLGKLKSKDAIEPLISLLKDTFFTVRLASENSIVAIGDSALIPLLNQLGANNENKMTFHIISALGRIAGEQDSVTQRSLRLSVKKAILPFLDDKEKSLRSQAVKALSLLNDEDTDELLEDKKNYETDPFVIGVYRKYGR